MRDSVEELRKQARALVNVIESGEPDSTDPVKLLAQRALFIKLLEQHIAILGKTGCGKTFTAKGFAELLLANKQRVCILDPTGVWWGLRSDKTGKRPAFPIYVFGGEHADLPLDPHAGTALAEIIGTTRTSAILDVSLLSVADTVRLFTDFAEAIFRKNRDPLNLIIDEADVFAPQGRVMSPQAGRMLHAANNLLARGRSRGLRITMITQRPAKLHKDSLTQASTLIAMRMMAPQDRNAVEDWIGEWADTKNENGAKDMLASLPSLATGEGWLWAPELGVLEQLTFPRITTYDSSRAPDESTKRVVLAKIDLQSIAERLAAAQATAEPGKKKKTAKPAEVVTEKPDVWQEQGLEDDEMPDFESLYFEERDKVTALEERLARLENKPLARTDPPSAKPEIREERQRIESNGHLSEELWQQIRARIAKDPVCLKIMATQPEIRFEVTKQTIEVDGSSLRGQVARLITEGFFDSTVTASAAYTELRKRGVSTAKPTVYSECDKLTTLGFLYKMGDGYQVVGGMKKQIIRR